MDTLEESKSSEIKKKTKKRGKALSREDALLQGEDLDTEIEHVAEEIASLNKGTKAVVSKNKQLEDLVEKILLYCQKQADTDLYEYQKEFGRRLIESLVTNDGDEISALFSRQSGKTETAATVIAGCMILLPILAKLMPEQFALEMYKKGVLIGK